MKRFERQSQSWRSLASGQHSGPWPPHQGPHCVCKPAPEPPPVPPLLASRAPRSQPAAHQGPRRVGSRPRLYGLRGPGSSHRWRQERQQALRSCPDSPQVGLGTSLPPTGPQLFHVSSPWARSSFCNFQCLLCSKEKHRQGHAFFSLNGCRCPRWRALLATPGVFSETMVTVVAVLFSLTTLLGKLNS